MEPRPRHRPSWPVLVGTAVVVAAIGLVPNVPSAQQPFMHLNPMVDKLAKGERVFGVGTTDFSPEKAHQLARADIDFVRIDMEHRPMEFGVLRSFLLGLLDKAAIARNGDVRASIAPIATFGPYGREHADWVAKQGLDIGLMGVIMNTVDNAEQALSAVRRMRYPQRRGARYPEPAGLRGYFPTSAAWFWGLTTDEYVRRADLWPLNPEGDLICIIMIESVEGLRNVNEIAQVPGVGMLFPGAGGDLSMSMGVPRDHPDREAGLQAILKACLAHDVPCGVLTNENEIQRRIEEGWKYLEVPGGVISAAGERALRAGRAALR